MGDSGGVAANTLPRYSTYHYGHFIEPCHSSEPNIGCIVHRISGTILRVVSRPLGGAFRAHTYELFMGI